jgi:hypothetical protein
LWFAAVEGAATCQNALADSPKARRAGIELMQAVRVWLIGAWAASPVLVDRAFFFGVLGPWSANSRPPRPHA